MKLKFFPKATVKGILTAALFGMLVSSFSIILTWLSIGVLRPLPVPQRRTLDNICFIAEAIRNYQELNGTIPASLDQITNSLPFPIVTEDWWGNAINYVVNGTNWNLLSYGRDSKPNGLGYDSDLSLKMSNMRAARPTFFQFVTERFVVSEVVFTWVLTTLIIGCIILRRYNNKRSVTLFFSEVLLIVSVGIMISCGFLLMRLAVIRF